MWRLLSPASFDRYSPHFIPDETPSGGASGGGGGDEDDLMIVGKADAATLALQLDRAKRARRDADNEAKNLCDRLRAAEQKLTGFEGEGVTVLQADDARTYQEYVALGKPAEIKSRLDERETLATEVATAKRDGTIRDAAQRYGYDYEALRAHTGDLPLVPYDADEDGKKVTKYRIGAGNDQSDMAEWVGKQPAYVGRALAVSADTPGQQGQQAGGVRYPAQGSGEPPKPTDAATSYLNRTYGPRKTA